MNSVAGAITKNAGVIRRTLGIASQVPGPLGRIAQAAETGLDLAGVPKEDARTRRRETRKDERLAEEPRAERRAPQSRRTKNGDSDRRVRVTKLPDGDEEIVVPSERL